MKKTGLPSTTMNSATQNVNSGKLQKPEVTLQAQAQHQELSPGVQLESYNTNLPYGCVLLYSLLLLGIYCLIPSSKNHLNR